jgi:Ser/Thr protein kinase RdoA (MazF antagonist)
VSHKNQSQGFFFELTPERVLAAVESSGLNCTGRCLTLNSFENRVYDVELESEVFSEELNSMAVEGQSSASFLKLDRRIVKFYRPGRWTEAQILEEHQFLADLNAEEIPAIAPLKFADGRTLHQIPGSEIYFAIFPKVGGRSPDELDEDQLRRVGRLLARIHNVGATRKAPNRFPLTPQTYGISNLEFLMQGGWVPLEFQNRYQSVVKEICTKIEPWFNQADFQRVHGDCHLGNLLWNSTGPFFLDFDDMVNAPPVQDLWMIVPGREPEAVQHRMVLLEGYEEFRSFDYRSLKMIEPLRALRIINYSAWIARRWDDPVFPRVFPQFGSHPYWSKELEALEDLLQFIQVSVDSGQNFI